MKRKLQRFDFDARGGRGDGKTQRTKACELCGAVAAVYCAADSAFLCSGCDAAVHGANFLVARHVRLCRCVTCGSLLCISGPESDPRTRVCGTCRVSHAQQCSSSHSDASSCVSMAESKKRRVEDAPTPTRGARARKSKPGRFARARATEVESVRRIARARKRVARDEEGWAESD